MGLGLTGAYGVAGAYDSLDKILAQRMLQRQYADKLQQQQFENQRQTAGDARQSANDALNVKTLAYNQDRQAKMDAQTQADKEVGFGNTLNESIPGGTFLPQGSKSAGLLRTAGVPLVDAPTRAAMGPEFQGPMSGDAAGPETPQEAQVGRPAGFLKTASQKQIDTNTDNARQAAAQKETMRHNRATEAAAVTKGAADKLTKVEHRDPTTGRTVIEWLPQSEIRGQKFDKGASGATETRLASAQAVNQTGEDIIRQLSDPATRATLGPILGRVSKLSDFTGNPPPEFSELAGAIESYALANMGVHGMRSAQGAEQIKKLMDGHHTPESLITTVKGLSQFSRHFMENEGRGGPAAGGMVKMTAPDGRSLSVPADKVAELEAKGAKRR